MSAAIWNGAYIWVFGLDDARAYGYGLPNP